MCVPLQHGLEDVLLVAHVQLLHRQQLAEPAWGQLPELLGARHVAEVRLQELRGGVVDVVKAVVQREVADADAVFCSDAALQELAAQVLEVGHEEHVGRLDHVLNGLLTQRDLCVKDGPTGLATIIIHPTTNQWGESGTHLPPVLTYLIHTYVTTEDVVQDLLHGGHGDPLQLDSVCRPIFLWGIVVELGPNRKPLSEVNLDSGHAAYA